MIYEIEIIKARFETIKVLLGESLTLEDLSSPKYLKALIDITENSYVHLNDSMCESLMMCKECAQNRELLSEYLNLFDDIELGRVIEGNEERVARYPQTIKEVIDKVNTVLNRMK